MLRSVLATVVSQSFYVNNTDLPVDACRIIGQGSAIEHYPNEGIIRIIHSRQKIVGEVFSGHLLHRDSRRWYAAGSAEGELGNLFRSSGFKTGG